MLCFKELCIPEAVDSLKMAVSIFRTYSLSIIKTSDSKVSSYLYVHVRLKCAYISMTLSKTEMYQQITVENSKYDPSHQTIWWELHCSLWRDRYTE